tara:strand:- start:3878 stop:4321 length:444 start_codon:yes stop_codon:yes gene_type:complete
MAWTKTSIGNGWSKLTETQSALASGTSAGVTSSAITGSMLNELAKAGSYLLEVVIPDTGTVVADTSIHGAQSDGTTYQSIATDIIADQNQNTTKVYHQNGVSSSGLKFNSTKDSGSGTAAITYNVVYWDNGPAQADMTIAGIGADPS